MLEWFAENAGTLVVSLLLTALVARIIFKLRRDRKQGKSSCGCNCGCCPMAGTCHKSA